MEEEEVEEEEKEEVLMIGKKRAITHTLSLSLSIYLSILSQQNLSASNTHKGELFVRT